MEGFNTEYILEKIAEMEDGEYSMSDIFKEGEIPEDASKTLQTLVKMAGTVVGMDLVNLGECGYDAYGVFSFLPENKGDACRVLSVVITLTDKVDQIGIYDMYQIINKINSRIPGGAFVISDDESTLSFRNYIMLPKILGNEDTMKNVGVRVFEAIACVTDWIDVIIGLNDGDLEYDACVRWVENRPSK
jgi:hypothetical protein